MTGVRFSAGGKIIIVIVVIVIIIIIHRVQNGSEGHTASYLMG
jgi:hypothetical protein